VCQCGDRAADDLGLIPLRYIPDIISVAPGSRVSNPGFTEPENPGNPEIFQTRKTGFGQPANPGFRV